jgi:ubiquinone/menaquinone biosynthesis C-methylase UbiE
MTTKEQYNELAKGNSLTAVLNTSNVLAKYRTYLDKKAINFLFKHLNYNLFGKTLLDVGCGIGRMFPVWKKYKLKVVGIDNSDGLLGVARKNYPGYALIEGDAKRLPIGDNSVDYSALLLILYHQDFLKTIQILNEACRVSDKGIIIMDEFYRKDSLWGKEFIEKHLASRGFKLKYECGMNSNWITRILNKPSVEEACFDYTKNIQNSSNWKQAIKIMLEFPIDCMLRTFNIKDCAWESILYFEKEEVKNA